MIAKNSGALSKGGISLTTRIRIVFFHSTIIAALCILFLGIPRSSAAPDGFGWALYPDPVGDSFGTEPKHDVRFFHTSKDTSNLTLDISFTGSITPPYSGGDEVFGSIDLDTDQNPATGATSHLLTYPQCQNPYLGVEYYIDLSDY